MGHKVQPTGFRLGITEEWRSRWYADKNYAENLGNDLAIRKYLEKRLAKAALSRVDIERAGDKVKVTIYTARPGIVHWQEGRRHRRPARRPREGRRREQGPGRR